MKQNYNLQPLHAELLRMYVEFAAFCEEYGLTHYLAYGTLLGAIRHHGFIPWDDDWDVYMPRPDYDRLVAFRGSLPTDFKLISLETEPSYKWLFAKISKTMPERRRVELEAAVNLKIGDVLSIDVFPLDGMPNGVLPLFVWRMQRALRRRWQCPEKLRDWYKSYPFDSCEYVGVANCEQSSPRRFLYEKRFFGKPKEVPFDGEMVLVPSAPEKVLEVEFGDWRKLPPKSERVPSHLICGDQSNGERR